MTVTDGTTTATAAATPTARASLPATIDFPRFIDTLSDPRRAKQAKFFGSQRQINVFSGGFGNGKTTALCAKAIGLSLRYPGNYGLIGRMTYPELRDTTQKVFFELLPPANILRWSSSEGRLVLKANGWPTTEPSEIIFRHLDKMSENEMKSLNLGFFAIDQSEEISENVFLILLSRLRRHVPTRFGMLALNPQPGWQKRMFKDADDPDIELVEATTYENLDNLPPDYIENLLKHYPEVWVKRFIHGDWEAFEGQGIPEFDKQRHVCEPFEIPDEWVGIIGIDPGYRNPTAVLDAAIDYDDHLWIVREHYRGEWTVPQHAEVIRPWCETAQFTVIDPSAAAHTVASSRSVIEQFNDCGIYPVGQPTDRWTSILRVKEAFRKDQITIFSSCPNLIREIPGLAWDTQASVTGRNAKEDIVKKDDHAFDVLRMIIASRPDAPEEEERQEPTLAERCLKQAMEKAARRDNMNWDETLGTEW